MPFYSVGGALTLFYAHSDVNSGVIANAFEVSGRGTFAGIHWRQHLVPIGAYSHAVEVGIDDRLFENDVVFAGAQLGVDVRTRPVLLGYNARLERVTWSIAGGIQYVHNLAAGGDSGAAAYEANRAGASRDWDAVRASLDGQWRVQPITFVARVRAQYSDDNLIAGRAVRPRRRVQRARVARARGDRRQRYLRERRGRAAAAVERVERGGVRRRRPRQPQRRHTRPAGPSGSFQHRRRAALGHRAAPQLPRWMRRRFSTAPP